MSRQQVSRLVSNRFARPEKASYVQSSCLKTE